MSVMIKGMKLPKNGEMKELTIGRAPNGSEPIAIAHGDTTEFYMVVELPTPHGRLIDADYLKKDRINISGTDFVLLVDVDNAKTIIEAEVSE